MAQTKEAVRPPIERKRRGRYRSAIKDGPEPVDLHVGGRIRFRRTLMGLTQSELGEALNLTFQQIQKYERGSNRVSASTLFRMAEVLDVPVSFFFEEMPGKKTEPALLGQRTAPIGRESLELLRNYYSLKEDVRQQIYNIVRMLSGTE